MEPQERGSGMDKPREPEVGDAVIFFDSVRRQLNAILTAVHGEVGGGPVEGHEDQDWWTPCVNLVFVVPEEDKTDCWGRQKDHASSCSHVSQQHPQVGYYWCFPEELETSRPDTSQVQTKR